MSANTKPPVWFWIVAIVFLVWNAMGCWNYIDQVTMNEEGLAALEERMRTFMENRPAWGTASFAIAVWGGLLAAIALLMRKSWATLLFIVSLFGVIGSIASDFAGVLDPSAQEMGFNAFLVIASIIEILVARMSARKGWIG